MTRMPMTIKQLREKKGYSQQEFANRIGVSQQAVAKWEQIKAYPRSNLLPKISQLLDCDISDLYEQGG